MAPNSTGPPKEVDLSEFVDPHILAKYERESGMIGFLEHMFSQDVPPPVPRDVSIETIREQHQLFRLPNWLDTTGWERVIDHEIISEDGAKIPARIYYPDPMKYGDGPYPVHLNYHGGGFVLGDLGSEASQCLSMRDGAGVAVIDVNYRHCPEAIWGKCFEDGWTALIWAKASATKLNVNPDSMSIGGISAGGAISVVLQHLARNAGIPLKLCLLAVTPTTEGLAYSDYTDSPFQSFHEFNKDPILPWAQTKYFGSHCMPKDKLPELKAMWPDWWFSPLRATNWDGLCDTFIRTAEIDMLRDECEAYGVKLIAGGTKVTFKRYIGVPHLFMYFPFLQPAKQFDLDAIEALKRAHGLI